MLPILFRIGPLEIPSFGVMVAIGILSGFYYLRYECREVSYDKLSSLVVYSVVAGMIGARLNFIMEHWHEIRNLSDFASYLIARSGLVAWGGILSGILVGYLYSRHQTLPALKILDAASPAICIGYFWGRLGCQLAGDGDYGTPSNLPWAMAYPNGTAPTIARVHPTPVYEMVLNLDYFCDFAEVEQTEPFTGNHFRPVSNLFWNRAVLHRVHSTQFSYLSKSYRATTGQPRNDSGGTYYAFPKIFPSITHCLASQY